MKVTINNKPIFNIEKNVERLDAYEAAKDYKYPFNKMEVGDSFLYSTGYTKSEYSKINSAACNYVRRQYEIKNIVLEFEIRKTHENGIRVWRVK